MDASVAVPRSAITSIVFLETNVPATHPSAAILGEERLGAGVAVAPDRVVTAHYLVMGERLSRSPASTASPAKSSASRWTTRRASPSSSSRARR